MDTIQVVLILTLVGVTRSQTSPPPCTLSCPIGQKCQVLPEVDCTSTPCEDKPKCIRVPPARGRACTTDNDCSEGSTCRARGRCQGPTCPMVCARVRPSSGRACTTDNDCSEGSTCRARGRCQGPTCPMVCARAPVVPRRKPCTRSAECSRGESCRVVPVQGCQEANCDTETICVRGRKLCTQHGDCDHGQTCLERSVPGCRGSTCPTENVCVVGRRTCTEDIDCRDGQTCLRRPVQGCQGDDCDMVNVCVQGRKMCTQDSDCRQGQTCRFRVVRGCRGRSCPMEQVCGKGRKLCEKDDDCDEDEDCVVRRWQGCRGDTCILERTCVKERNSRTRLCITDDDCAEGLACIPRVLTDCEGPDCEPVVTICRQATDCLRRHREAMLGFAISAEKTMFVPRCDLRGRWQPIQCLDQLGLCWCVNTVTGAQLATPVKGQPNCANLSSIPVGLSNNQEVCENGEDVRVCSPTLCMEQPGNDNIHCRIDPCGGCKVVYLDANNQVTSKIAGSACDHEVTEGYRIAISQVLRNKELSECVLLSIYDDVTLGYSNGLQLPRGPNMWRLLHGALSSCQPCLARGAQGGQRDRARSRPGGETRPSKPMGAEDDNEDESDGGDTEGGGGPRPSRNSRPGLGTIKQVVRLLNRLDGSLNVSDGGLVDLMVKELARANALLRSGRCPMPGAGQGDLTCTENNDTSCGPGIKKCCPDGRGGHVCMDPIHVIIPKATPTCEAREARGGRPTTRGGYQYTQCFSQDPTYCVCVNDFGEIARGMMREGGSLVCDKNGIVSEEDTKKVSCPGGMEPQVCRDACHKVVDCTDHTGIPQCIFDICGACNTSYVRTTRWLPNLEISRSPLGGAIHALSYPGETKLRDILNGLLERVIATPDIDTPDIVSDNETDTSPPGSGSRPSQPGPGNRPPRPGTRGQRPRGPGGDRTRPSRGVPSPEDKALRRAVAWFQKGATLLLRRLLESLPAFARGRVGPLPDRLLPGGSRPSRRDSGTAATNRTVDRHLTCKAVMSSRTAKCDLTTTPSVCDDFPTMADCTKHCQGVLCKDTGVVRVCKTYECEPSAKCEAYPELQKCVIDPCTCEPVFLTATGLRAECKGQAKGLCARYKAMSRPAMTRRPGTTCGLGARGPPNGRGFRGRRPGAQGRSGRPGRPGGQGQRPGTPGRPGGQGQRPGTPGPPGGQGQRPGTPGPPGGQGQRPGRPGRPGGQGQRPGRPGRPGGQGQRPGRQGRPGGQGQRPGSARQVWQIYSLPFNVTDIKCAGEDFAPMQCGETDCVCVDPLNRPIKGKRGGHDLSCDTLALDRTVFNLTFNGSLQRIDVGVFKQALAEKIAKMAGAKTSDVIITEVKSGSIKAAGYISQGNLLKSVEFATIELYGLELMYGNTTLVAPPGESHVNFMFNHNSADIVKTTTSPPQTDDEGDGDEKRHSNKLTIIIVCVVVIVVIIIIISVIVTVYIRKKQQATFGGSDKSLGFTNSGYDSQIDEKGTQ